MKTKILFVLLVIFYSSCSNQTRLAESKENQEKQDISDNTIVINIEDHVVEKLPLSKLVRDVSYLELETSDSSFLYLPMDIKMTDSLIYIFDIEEQLKCFDMNGKFVRNGYSKGNGPREVIRLYDFDVDRDYLYLLDGTRSTILRFTHNGEFVDKQNLPLRALRFKHLSTGGYIFELAPFGLNNSKEYFQVAITDSKFNIVNKYFTQDIDKEMPVTRSPYFENCKNSTFFAPIYQRSIYQLHGDSLSMKYYLDFNSPYYEPSRDINGPQEAMEKRIYYTYYNPLHSNNYLLQAFVTSVDMKGLLVINQSNNKTMFIKEIENDMDNMINFDFRFTKFYDTKNDLFVGFSDFYEEHADAEEDVNKAKSQLNDSISSILIRKEKEEINPILIFYRLQPVIGE